MVQESLPHPLYYGCQSVDDEDIAAVTSVLRSDFLTTGPVVEAFEQRLCEITGAKYCIACANGTAALHLACMAVGVGPGDLGLTSPLSFLASANCIEYCRGKADFIDIDSQSLCLSPEGLAEYCRDHEPPRVVIPVDFAGIPADLPALAALSKQYGFALIEDAAHSLGSFYKYCGRQYACGACVHTDLAVFSFHPVKTITTAEGGAVMTNNEELAARVRGFRNHGMQRTKGLLTEHGGWFYEMHEPGFNYRLSDLQCALGISQLNRLDRFRKRRREIVSHYNQAFRSHDSLILPPKALAETACPHLYPIRIKAGNEARRQVYEALKENNIFCQVHYIPIHLQPYYARKYGYTRGKCPKAERYYSRCLSLPLFPAMSDDDVRWVIDSFLAALKNAGA